ncbi:MAG: MMPL family transporter [Candidatus Omnitrophota bacterium]
MRKFLFWFSHGLIRYRLGFLSLCLLISLFFFYQLKDLSFNTNLGDFYPLKHPYLKIQNQLNKIFGGLNQVSIAIEVKDGTIVNPVTLDKIWQITNDLYLTEGINAGRVVSLSARKVKHVEANDEGFKTTWLMHDPPKSVAELETLKQRIIRNPMVLGPMVSEDFKATLIQADFESDVSSRKIFNILQDIKKKYEDDNHSIYMAGQPVLQGWLDFYLRKMGALFLITLLAMSWVLFNAFKSKRGVFLPLASASMATIWGLGMTALFGYKLTPATILAPFLVFALGVSHSVQFIKRYYEYMSKHKRNSKMSAIKITRNLFVPAFTGLLTDGIAPFTLFFVPLGMVKSLAVAIGFGILSIFFSTIILVPNLLSFMKPPKRLEVIKEERTTLTNRVLSYFAKLAVHKRSRWTVIASFFILTFISLWGASRLEVGDKQPGTSLLYSNSPYNKAEKFISEKFATSDPYYIFVEGKHEDALYSTEVLKEMDSLQRYLEKEVLGVGRTLSLVEYIKGMNMAMFGGRREAFKIPETDQTVAEYIFLYSLTGFPGDFDPVANPNYQYANIKVDLRDHKASTIHEALDKTGAWIREHHKAEDVEFSYAGGTIGMLAAVNDTVRPMLSINSFGTASLVLVCLVVAYGWVLGTGILFLPLIFRTVLLFGILGFLRIGLTAEIIPVVALGIGFGDDFGIYIVSRVMDELQEKGGSLSQALIEAMSTSGKAVFFTGLSLAIGIATWMFSPILMQARLGALLSFLILFNAIGTLIVLPSMLMTLKPKLLKR